MSDEEVRFKVTLDADDAKSEAKETQKAVRAIDDDDGASGALDTMRDKASDLADAVKTATAAVSAAAAAAAVAVVKSATEAYADYEQLVGGAEKLFGDSADALVANAQNAAKTTGLSANDYLEQVTSFSASLISSLDNDTEAAVSYADTAMQDMADNANTFGTDIESIQNAYQGFAKQNYTMLDNLKLGYGGTQSEMERLIEDANAVKEANGEMADLSIDSFADIVEAIHTMQEEQGIAGTTAKEASETISGSISTLQAEWENWLTVLAGGYGDIESETAELVADLGAVIGNVVPVAAQALSGLGSAVVELLPDAIAQVAEYLDAQLPEAFGTPFSDAVAGVADVLGTLWETVQPIIEPLGELLSETFGTALEVFGTVSEAVSETLMPALGPLAETFAGLLESVTQWVEPLGNVASLLGTGLVTALTAVVEAATFLLDGVSGVLDWLMSLSTYLDGTALPAFSEFVSGVIAYLSTLPSQVAALLSTVISNVASWASSMVSSAISAASSFLSSVVNGIASLPSQVAAKLSAVISSVASWAASMASSALSAGQQFVTNIVSALSSAPSQVASIGANIVSSLARGITNAAGQVASAITGVVNSAISSAKKLLGIASPSKVFKAIGQYVSEGLGIGVEDYGDMAVSAVEGVASDMAGVEMALSPTLAPAYAVSYGTSYELSASALQSDLGALGSQMGELASALGSGDGYVSLSIDGRELARTMAKPMDRALSVRASRRAV